MTDIWSSIGSWSILKWVALVLIAAFIGQFGKMAANAIAARIRARRQQTKNTPDTPDTPAKLSVPESPSPSPSASSPDKKLLKAMAKAKKKEAKKKS